MCPYDISIELVTISASSIDVSFWNSSSPLNCLNRKQREKYKENAHHHLVSPHFILFGTHWFILMPVQVLYWAKEEDKTEKLKARLIELYYENLFKVSYSLFCANSVS
jgi:hypothetical protein